PDGTVVARERVVYAGTNLLSFELEDLRSGERGQATRRRGDAARRDVLHLEFAAGGTKPAVDEEALQPDTLINHMLPAFIVSHWAELMAGRHARFRFVALSRTETVGFEIFKEGELMREGRAVVRLRMEPTSMVIAHLVAPLLFLVEKEGAHR